MRLLSIGLLLLVLASCKDNHDRPDVSGVKVQVAIQRFDRDFFSLDTNHLSASLESLYKKYPSFLPLYFEFLSPVNFIVHQNGKSYSEAVLEYFRNMKSLEDSVLKKFPDREMERMRKEIESGFRYVKYYYPSFELPAVYTSVESLNPENPQEIYGTTYYHDTLIISLQMFLGKDFQVYDPTQYFDYLRRRFEPEYIVPNSIRALAGAVYADSSQDASLIEQMIEKGKQWYLLDHFLPDTPDSLKTFFTQRQLEWCTENEGNIWASVVANTPDLYTVDRERVQNYLGEAPFTQDMSHEASPGNIGQWIGWRIVRKFAEKNTQLSLQQVMATPAKQIFQEAKYKPK
jgi:hypothetical protein